MKNKEIFDLVHNIGEGIFHSLHIINISDEYENGLKYRIYHSDGYCFEITREEIENLDDFISEFGNINIGEYYYSFQYDLFDGFNILTIDEAINLLQPYL
jgi:hypothetical protein